MAGIKFRRYDKLPPVTGLLIAGRRPTRWMLDHMWDISQDDFYNQSLTEADLECRYPDLL